MSKRALTRILGPLTVPLLLASACTDATSSSSSASEEVANEHISITKIELADHELYVLHPVRVSVEAELHGDAYEADILVGLRTTDRSSGCVLGSMPVNHAGELSGADGQASPSVWTGEGEFVIGLDCGDLGERDDVELFTAFDPWDRLGEREDWQGPVVEDANDLNIYPFVAEATLGSEDCETCEATYELGRNPGRDATLLEMNVGSVIATVDQGRDTIAATDKSAFTVTTRSQMRGLAKGQSIEPGPVRVVHRLRPAGSSATGLALTQRRGALVEDSHAIEVDSHGDQTVVSPLFIEGELLEQITRGAWSDIEAFELVSCIETDFDQAIYTGELAPRDNDCGAVEVIVVRDEGLVPYANAGAARDAEVWSDGITAGSSYGFGESGITMEAWLDVNGSEGVSSTYRGIDVTSAGSWYEAGFTSTGTVFDNSVDIIDIYATFIGYDFGGGGVAMGAEMFGYEFVPEFEIQLSDGIPLSLQDMFDAANLDIDPTYSKSVSLLGVNFDDGCGSVSVGIWIEGTIGIDTEQTTVTAATTSQGVAVTGVVTPFFDITAEAGATVNYSEFISGSLTVALNLLLIELPFEVSVEVIDYDALDGTRLQFDEYASATLSSLSGSIKFSFKFDAGWWDDDHTHTIATWSGYNWGVDFFDLNQNLNLGSDAPGTWCTTTDREMFDGDFNGDGSGDWLCHNPNNGDNWIDFGPSYGSTNWDAPGTWCTGADRQLLVGDFNGNGRTDAFCRSASTQWIDYAEPNGHLNGTNWSRPATWCTGANAMIQAADYNNDGRDDLYCRNKVTGMMYLDYADPQGRFGGTNWSGLSLP